MRALILCICISLCISTCILALACTPTETIREMPEADARVDPHPPMLASDEFLAPEPLDGPINTAGAEDSPFMTPDGRFFFFFTPDPNILPEKQLLDGVTGIYETRSVKPEMPAVQKTEFLWQEPTRVRLQKNGKLSLDGCAFVEGDDIWFCSAREGYTGIHWFHATLDEPWKNWEAVDDSWEKNEVGEMHIHKETIYFHSARAGGKGGYDLWSATFKDGVVSDPINLEVLNSPEDDGWPFVTQDGLELWFTRIYAGSPAVYRSRFEYGAWQKPELIVSSFAGEPTLDAQGNLYFVHHYFDDDHMLEADIFVAKRK